MTSLPPEATGIVDSSGDVFSDLGLDKENALIGMIQLRDEQLKAARARIAELEKAQAWQDIETAPKDGTFILACYEGK